MGVSGRQAVLNTLRFTAALMLWPLAATAAEPITLKLAFFTSDQSISYKALAEPFVKAVNEEANGLIKIEPYFSGALGKDIAKQPDLLRDGSADIAFVVPGYSREQFPDNPIVEMPGMYRDLREATMIYTQLVAESRLRGYEDFFVIGAYMTGPATFHSRLPFDSLRDLQGKKIRVNNPSEALLISELGGTPALIQVNQITAAIGVGTIDAVLVAPTPMQDYGVKRVTNHHFLLETNGAPLALMMSRKKFDSLPEKARDIIRKYSGEWAAKKYIDIFGAAEKQIIDDLKADPRRVVTVPSPADRKFAEGVFSLLANHWADESDHQAALMKTARAALTKIRANQ